MDAAEIFEEMLPTAARPRNKFLGYPIFCLGYPLLSSLENDPFLKTGSIRPKVKTPRRPLANRPDERRGEAWISGARRSSLGDRIKSRALDDGQVVRFIQFADGVLEVNRPGGTVEVSIFNQC
ncbi:MAG: hypothetical protein SFX18_15220 [Pirellulales bacterium]|nr:hypothetical protein [Pirellulales bacterium]